MGYPFRMALSASAIFMPVAIFAQTGPQSVQVSDYEGHFVRGLLERQNEAIQFSKLALTQSADPAVKAIAQEIIGEDTAAQASLRAVGNKYNAVTPRRPGAGPGGPPGGPGGPPAGGPPGGPPGGGRGGPGGGVEEKLQASPAATFNNLYLLDEILILEEIERSIDLEIATPASNPDLVAWARANQETYRKQAREVQKVVRGEGAGVDNPLERDRGTANAPGGGPTGG